MGLDRPPEGAGPRRAPPLRIALLAPPWLPVPPHGYGGIESVVDLLARQLVAEGHDVTLFAAPGSRSTARLRTLLAETHPDEIGASMYESDHVARAREWVEVARAIGRPFDVIHDHSGFTAVAFANLFGAPVVHTLHGPFTARTSEIYARHGHKATLVAISQAQVRSAPAPIRIDAVVPNPVMVEHWPLRVRKEDYVLWMGRMDPVKGPDVAVAAARRAGRRLVLAGPVQPGQETFFRERIAPHVDGDRVRYVGEVAGTRRIDLFANAAALLMPVRWAEPFGMVMVEALACGTPVVAFAQGATQEVVLPGVNGFLVADEVEMADALGGLDQLDPLACRASVQERYDVSVVTSAYVDVYRRARAAASPPDPDPGPAAELMLALGPEA